MTSQTKRYLSNTIDILEVFILLGVKYRKILFCIILLVLTGSILINIFENKDSLDITKPIEASMYEPSILGDGYPAVISEEHVKQMLIFDASQFQLVSPVRSLEVTSAYGGRVHPVTGEDSFHAGIDIRAEEGEVITLPYTEDTKYKTIVDYIGYNNIAGNHVQLRITAPNKTVLYVLYAHLKNPSELELGSSLNVGDIVGYVGSTGLASGPHLHVATRKLSLEDDGRVTLKGVNPSNVFKNLATL